MTLRRQTPLISPRRTFLDSSSFLALVNPLDVYHEEAQTILTRLTNQYWQTYCSNFVIAETHALFIIRLGHRHATTFLQRIRLTNATLVRVTAEVEQRAEQIIFAYLDKVFSYTDCTSFAVMERFGITHAFTFYRNLTQYGLQVLTA